MKLRIWIYAALVGLLFGCASANADAPDPGESMTPSEMAPGLFEVHTMCRGPVGMLKDEKHGKAMEVYSCLNGVLMLRPVILAENPPEPKAE